MVEPGRTVLKSENIINETGKGTCPIFILNILI